MTDEPMSRGHVCTFQIIALKRCVPARLTSWGMEQTHEGGEPSRTPGKRATLDLHLEATWICTSGAKAPNLPNARQLTVLLQRSQPQCVSPQIHVETLTPKGDGMSR